MVYEGYYFPHKSGHRKFEYTVFQVHSPRGRKKRQVTGETAR